MQKRLKPFPLLPFGVYPRRAPPLFLSPSKSRRPEASMAVSTRLEFFHSIWSSSSIRRAAHPLSRKKGMHFCQGRIVQYSNFCSPSIKCMEINSSLATGPATFDHLLLMEDNASYQQSNSSGKFGQMDKLSTYDIVGIANEGIGCNNQSDRAQVHTPPAGTVEKINPSRNSSPDSSRSRNAWSQEASKFKQYCEQFTVNHASVPVEATAVAKGVEEAKKTILEGTQYFEISSRTPSSNQLAQREEKTAKIRSNNEDDVQNEELKKRLARIYDRVLVIDNVTIARQTVLLLTTKYKNLIHACDTEVSRIDVKQETPVDHGELICFSIYSGTQADFGNGKSYIWVDVLDGGHDVLMEFAPFFENPKIKKVWHNYSFDFHIIESCGIHVSGFHADTMHLARLWDSSRKLDGGYSLEALSGDPAVMSKTGSHSVDELMGKISMKKIFGKRKLKKDGSEGKSITMVPVELLQKEDSIPWICYSVLDSISTLRLYESLKAKLEDMDWDFNGLRRGSMYNFYEEYWRPFGSLLANMEAEGLLVDRSYLSEVEKIAIAEQRAAAEKFCSWASKYCPDAKFMNVGSDAQIRQLFFGGEKNRKDSEQSLPLSKPFKVPNTEKFAEDGKNPTKYRTINLHSCGKKMHAEIYTASGWPSMSGDALKTFAGKISPDCIYLDDDGLELGKGTQQDSSLQDSSIYGSAFEAFGGGNEGKRACHAIAALCEVCSIDSLISNFILPLQGTCISGKDGRIHSSININTETGRLSARRPNLQNQPALEKDRYKIRQAFIAEPGNSLIVADYGQLELRILAHLANCKSMLDAFKAGGDFHSRTAMNMYKHVHDAVKNQEVLLEWFPQTGEEKPPVPLLKDAFAAERRKAKMLNFSIAYGKTAQGLARDWKVTVKEAKETVTLWYQDRQEVSSWQEKRKEEVLKKQCVHTLLGRARRFPSVANASNAYKSHIERAAINTPVQGSAADVAMCAMLEINRNPQLKKLGWRLLLQVHDEVILEGPTESSEIAKKIVVECMSKPFYGKNILKVDLAVDAKCAQNWYAAK